MFCFDSNLYGTHFLSFVKDLVISLGSRSTFNNSSLYPLDELSSINISSHDEVKALLEIEAKYLFRLLG
jgi:hypothetical protein